MSHSGATVGTTPGVFEAIIVIILLLPLLLFGRGLKNGRNEKKKGNKTKYQPIQPSNNSLSLLLIERIPYFYDNGYNLIEDHSL